MYRIEQRQQLPITIEEAWAFFSNPNNLHLLTPEWMHLTFRHKLSNLMYEGMITEQDVRPLFRMRINWVTEITHIKEHTYFIDEQRMGPFRFWHHEHRLRQIDGGVEVIDTLDYAMPFGILGRIAHELVVHKKMKEVFAYRQKRLETIFGL